VTASSRYDKQTKTRGEKVKIKFCRRMKFFLAKGGSCSYDDESIGDIDLPLRYKHMVQQWVPKELPPIDVDFVFNNRTYRRIFRWMLLFSCDLDRSLSLLEHLLQLVCRFLD